MKKTLSSFHFICGRRKKTETSLSEFLIDTELIYFRFRSDADDEDIDIDEDIAMEEDDEGVNLRTIKTLNKSAIKDFHVRRRINTIVREVSKIVLEACLYINFVIYNILETELTDGQLPAAYLELVAGLSEKNYIYNNFFQVFEKHIRSNLPGPSQSYLDFLRESGLEDENGEVFRPYETKNLQQILKSESFKYQRNLKTNLKRNGFKRVWRYIRDNNVGDDVSPEDYKIIKRNVTIKTKLLFGMTVQDNMRDMASDVLLGSMASYWEDDYFSELYRKPFIYLWDFYVIQKFNQRLHKKNFVLLPTAKYGLRHIFFDKETFSRAVVTDSEDKKNILGDCRDTWKKYLELPRNKHWDKFNFTFETDSYSISIHLKKPVRNNLTENSEPPVPQQPTQKSCAIDSGSKVLLGCTSIEHPNKPWDGIFENFKLTSSEYFKKIKYYERENKRKKITAKIDKKIEDLRKEDLLRLQETEQDYPPYHKKTDYIKFQRKHMKKKNKIYLNKNLAKLKFEAWRERQKFIDNYVTNTIIGTADTVTVYYGASHLSANSPIRGYRRGPHSLFRKTLEMNEKITLIYVDEYNTTKFCSKCMSKTNHVVSRSPHRYSFCSTCGTLWNRDINAANNILIKGYISHVEGDNDIFAYYRSQ